jgi:PAS domain S-box-containing protein
MTRRPTYEELEQRVKELEKLEAKCKCAEEDLLDAEHKWMSLIENTNDFIMIIDNNSRIQYINRTIPPNTVDQVTGKTLYDFAAPEHHEMIRQTVAKTFETRKQGSYTSCVKHPTGIQWFETTVVPIIKEGKVSSAMSFNKIITERKQAEEALRESEEKHRTLLENIPQKIFFKDADSIYVSCNQNYAKDLKINSEEITGKTDYEFYPKELAEKYREDDKKIIQIGETVEIEEKYIINGQNIFVQTVKTPVRDEIGNVIGILGIFWDITERKQAEEALRKAYDELKERTRELKIKTKSLEEINTAMKVLLKKREDDKTELEDNVLTNVKELVEPYFEKIKKTELDDQQEAFLSIIESNMKEIISPFTRKMSLKYLNLTPTEIQVANMTKHGNSSKKIAKVMNISPRTVDTHKKNIRRKIGLQGTRGNLRSYLLALH